MFNDDDDFKQGIDKWAEKLRSEDDKGEDHSFSENLNFIADRHRSDENKREKHTNEENLGLIADQHRSYEDRGRILDWAENKNKIANSFRASDDQRRRFDREDDGKAINNYFTPPREYNGGRSTNTYYSDSSTFAGIFVIFLVIGVIFFSIFIAIKTRIKNDAKVSYYTSKTTSVDQNIPAPSQPSSIPPEAEPPPPPPPPPPPKTIEEQIADSYSFNEPVQFDMDYNIPLEKILELGNIGFYEDKTQHISLGISSSVFEIFATDKVGSTTISVYFVFLKEEYHSEKTIFQIIDDLDKLGYRPAELGEMLCFMKNFGHNEEAFEYQLLDCRKCKKSMSMYEGELSYYYLFPLIKYYPLNYRDHHKFIDIYLARREFDYKLSNSFSLSNVFFAVVKK